MINVLKNKFEEEKVKTILEIFRVVVIYSLFSSILGISFSIRSVEEKLVLITLAIIIVTFIFISLKIIDKRSKSNVYKIRLYFIVILTYTFYVVLVSYSKYFTTTGIAISMLIVITYIILSKKYLLINGLLILFFISIISAFGIGKTVELGFGYYISNVGTFAVMIYVLLKSIKMFEKYNDIYVDQLFDLNSRNDELDALNEEYAAAEEILMYNMDHDQLTGVLNWKGFYQSVEKRLDDKDNSKFFVFMIDIDDFLYINNAFGYDFGDKVIIQIANKLKNSTEIVESLARGEGDSFMFTTDIKYNVEDTVRLITQILSSIIVDESPIRIKASYGISESEKNSNIIELIRNAEVAMYKAKKRNKGSFSIHKPHFVKEMDEQYKIFSILEEAIENNEFYNMYQPKVDSFTGELIGFEALVRWESKVLGTVYPNEFIQVAEHTGHILRLGDEISRNAMRFAKRISEINDGLVVSINISSKQLFEEDFIDKIKSQIKTIGVSTKNIAFEVTETAYIENLESVNNILLDIQNLGIKIYLDDFGTGYSSLSYLNKLPIQILKIDKSFIENIHLNEQTKKLVKVIIDMAKNLNLKCIAEGVEYKEQLDILKELECEYIQGYLFSKPVLEENALKMIIITK